MENSYPHGLESQESENIKRGTVSQCLSVSMQQVFNFYENCRKNYAIQETYWLVLRNTPENPDTWM